MTWSSDASVLDISTVAEHFGTDVVVGLTSAEASARLEQAGPNRLDPALPVPAWRRVLAELCDPLVLLLVGAVVISLVVWGLEGADGVPFEAVVISAILAANAALGYVQEAQAEHAVAALQRMAAASATVVRDGVERRVPVADVVPGEVLLLTEGDAVSADGRIVESASLAVAEAALTGESEPVNKSSEPLGGPAPVADRTNMVFSGTAVTRGRARVIVTGTGMTTEMGRIAHLIGSTAEDPTPLQREIARVSRILGITVLLIATVVIAAILATSDVDDLSDLIDVLLIGVSLAVAAVPEGLPAVLSVVLAVGVQRMARRNAIVKQLSSVETLGSASVICSDKTGTLTRNEMTIQQIVTHAGAVDVTGSGYIPVGELLVDGQPIGEGPLRDEVALVLSGGSLANDASLRPDGAGWVAHGDPTEVAFLVAARKAGCAEARLQRFRRVGELPFSSDRMRMTTLHADAAHPGRVMVVSKGAPDVLLTRCTSVQVGSRAQPLTAERRAAILATVDVLADRALRTLGVAYRSLEAPPPIVDEGLEQGLVFAGVVGMIDPPRPEAKRAIAAAERAGIRVVMITGDHPRTAAMIAAELGIGEVGFARVIAGAEIDELDDTVLRDTARQTSVYARVAPEHKLRIVDALQADGNIVAMTGDGVNDAPALKSADIGIAMGVAGTDVTKEAGKMILADDNFATIVAAVREGRGIFSNIQKFLRYLLSSNAGEVLTMLIGVLAAGAIGLDEVSGDVAVPLLATQVLWINLLTDTAPALALGVDPPPGDVMAGPPRRLTDRVIDNEMLVGVLFVGLVMAAATLLTLDLRLPGGLVAGSGTLTEARTMGFTTLVLAQLFNCFNARSKSTSALRNLFTNPLLWAAVTLSLVMQVAVVHLRLLNEAFDTTGLDGVDWWICIGMASSVLWAEELRKLVRRRRERRSTSVRRQDDRASSERARRS